MKIAIITPGDLPIPSIMGGAIETLVTHLINQNETNGLLDIDVYTCIPKSCYDRIPTYGYTKILQVDINIWKQKVYQLYARMLRLILLRKIPVKQYYAKICGELINCSGKKYDYIIVEGNHYQVMQLAHITHQPIILHMHTDMLNIDTPQGAKICESCEKIIVISRFLKNKILSIDNKYVDKVIVLKNAIDIRNFGLTEHQKFREEFRRNHSISDREMVFIFCGRVDPSKGVLELIKAFKKLTNPCRLIIVGANWFNSCSETSYDRKLKKLSSDSNNRIIYTGYISYNKIPQYYYAADIGVFPSICNEAAGLVIIEALASGLPVISTRMGGIPEYADNRACSIIENDCYLVDRLSDMMAIYLDDIEYYKNKKAYTIYTAKKYGILDYYRSFIKIIYGESNEKSCDNNIPSCR